MAIAGGYEDSGDGTLFADPAILDAVEYLGHVEEIEADLKPEAKAQLSNYQQMLLARFFDCTAEDVPHKIDVRSWPQAHGLKARFVENTEGFTPPAHRLKMLKFSDGRVVYECWTPVPRPIESFAELTGQLPIGEWMLTYHVYDAHWCDCPQAKLTVTTWDDGSVHAIHKDCGRERPSRVEGNIDDHVSSLQLAPEDDSTYNGYYGTIRGNDVAHHDPTATGMRAFQGGDALRAGQPNADGSFSEIRGGTEIRGGRREWREKTKDYVQMDNGYWKDVDRYAGEVKAQRDRKMALNEEIVHKRLPRKIGEV